MHIGGCSLYDGTLSKDELCSLIESRFDRLPQYRQKAVFAPLNIAHPTWEDDPDFDLAYHVDECTLPPPADDRVVSQVCSQLFTAPLDRNRPLWKLTLLHGRPDGNTLILARIHQAMLEGVSGIDLMLVLHDLRPDTEHRASASHSWEPEAIPDALTLVQEAVRDRITEVAEWWTDQIFQALRSPLPGSRSTRFSNALMSVMPTLMQPVPHTPFNAALSDQRQLTWLEFSFAEARFIRSVLRGTVNDVVLAIIAGGIGRYLRAQGYKTDGLELRVASPVDLKRHEPRGRRSRHSTGRTATMLIPLYVGIIDPILRLSAQKATIEELYEQDQAGTFHALQSLATCIPPAWQAFAGPAPSMSALANTVVMNIPGPQVPLYLAGHKRHAFLPMGPLAARVGLFHAVASYNQKLSIGVTLDPQLIPDGWEYAGCLKASFLELREAAERFSNRSANADTRTSAAEAAGLSTQEIIKAEGTWPDRPVMS